MKRVLNAAPKMLRQTNAHEGQESARDGQKTARAIAVCIERVGAKKLAAELGVGERRIHKWKNSEVPIPQERKIQLGEQAKKYLREEHRNIERELEDAIDELLMAQYNNKSSM